MNRILIIKLGALGDVVMATSLVSAIVEHHRPAPVDVLTTPAFAAIFASLPGVAVQAMPRHGAGNFWRMLSWVRDSRFRRVYDLQSSDRTALLCLLSGISERVGNHPRPPYSHHPAQPWRGQSHIYERMTDVLASAGVPAPAPLPNLPAPAASAAAVARWLDAQQLARGQFALLHAGASRLRPEKRWPHFQQLGEALEQRGIRVVWLGGEEDRALNRTLSASCGIDAAGAFDIPGLAELGRAARFAVTNDSGPMHVLAASNIPVFGLFGPSDWRRNHALGQRDRVIATAAPGDDMNTIAAATVLERLQTAALLY